MSTTDKPWPIHDDEIEAEVTEEITHWHKGQRVFAKLESDSTWTIRPKDRLGPTMICVPRRYVRPIEQPPSPSEAVDTSAGDERQACSVFMENKERCLSTIRAIVETVMIKLGHDNADWRKRDELIVATAPYLSKHEAENARLQAELAEAKKETKTWQDNYQAEVEFHCDRYEKLQAELAAVRELMNVYNCGGWTDTIGPMRRALRAEAELAAANEKADYYREVNDSFSRQHKEIVARLSVQLSEATHTGLQWVMKYRDAEAELAALREQPQAAGGETKATETTVCCFRTKARSEDGVKRYGIWAMTREDRGAFFHGSRNEICIPKWDISELADADEHPNAVAITPAEAIEELANWPEAQAELRKIFERHPTLP